MSEQPLADSALLPARRVNRIRQLAGLLARWRVSANQLAALSVLFAAAGAGLMQLSPWWLLGAALCVQLRYLSQLLAALLATEFERRTPATRLYQELANHLADPLLLVAAGYAAGLPALGWFGALAVTLAAFVRVIGGMYRLAPGAPNLLPRQQRMHVLTMACLLHAMSHALPWMAFGVGIIAAGSALTCVLRARALTRALLGESDVTTQSNVNS